MVFPDHSAKYESLIVDVQRGRDGRTIPRKCERFIFNGGKGIDAAALWRSRCKFYSVPSFRRYRIRGNLNSAADSRGKPEGPNIIPGTRGGRHAWDLTCIHFPNRRVNVKNTVRVFSRRGGQGRYSPDGNVRRGWSPPTPNISSASFFQVKNENFGGRVVEGQNQKLISL